MILHENSASRHSRAWQEHTLTVGIPVAEAVCTGAGNMGRILTGQAHLFLRDRDLGIVTYRIELDIAGRAQVVQFDRTPDGVDDGDVLHVVLQDGRTLECSILDHTPYCAIIGYGPRP